ncbi:DinB family protein [Pedobacter panaciterrae]|jgi:hypothetical protein|uniref:DinB family protein n=1 Tax=Pedobacter panaciterrae TaxID=363849 RepID=A0ABU8NKE9_9SPHI|nr:DinB family protein [Pedobacter panaciterrae]NQX56323.1 DinB family protein [Pedobacter panaciterrae]
MEIKTTSERMYALLVLFDMHTSFYSKAILGITTRDAHNRLNTKANHVSWLAGSLVEQRYYLANMLGISGNQTAHKLFENHQGIIENATYPPLSEFNEDWDKISPLLRDALIKVTDEKLNEEIDMGFEKMTAYELIAFIIYREANCIGQIALWRRLLGYEAIKYD